MAHALDAAAQRWPGESRAALLVRLIRAGEQTLAKAEDEALRARRDAIRLSSGKYDEAFDDGYLTDLQQDWPE